MNRTRKILWVKVIPDDYIRELLDERRLQIARTYKRFLAYIVDVGLVGFSAYYIMVIKKFAYSGFEATSRSDLWSATSFFFFLLMIIYYLICIPVLKRTLGMWIVGITLMSIDGERINCVQVIGRGAALGLITVGIFPYIVILHCVLFVLILWRGDKFHRAFWDASSQTIVVEKQTELLIKK